MMNEAMTKMVETFNGNVLLGGTVVMFSTNNFKDMFMKVYETGLENGKKEWVGLTQDDICKTLLGGEQYNTEVEFMAAAKLVDATEALIKEKNT